MSGSSIDPRLASILAALSEAEECIASGRSQNGLDAIRSAEKMLAEYMDLDMEQWREQAEFLP